MSMSAPVERVVAFLKQADFRLLPAPLIIRQSTFEFPAVLMGPGEASDIVLVADTVNAKDTELVRRIQGVARSLDLARSRNPLTAVLVGPRPVSENVTKLMQVCRVLPVGTIPHAEDQAAAHLSNWLAVLTPLDQIDTDGVVADPMAALASRISDLSEEVQGLSRHVPQGAGAVEAGVNDLLTERLSAAWKDEV